MTYAIVDIADKQFKVQEDETLYVPHLSDFNVDDTFTVDRVLLTSNGDGDVQLGAPVVEGVRVEARVLNHVKGDKVIVFKKKRRKRYRVKRGHRQQYTQIRIEALSVDEKDQKDEESETQNAEPQKTAEAA